MLPQPLRCHFEADAAPGAPRVWAIALPADPLPAPPEATRQRARHQARTALRALLAQAYALPVNAIHLDDQRGGRVRATLAQGTPPPVGWQALGLSISHTDAVVLLALRPAGAVGVDLAVLPTHWGADRAALRQQAALYLGPAHAAARGDDAAQPAARLATCFVQGWADLEARLKCIEQPLAEWSPALAQRLAACHAAALVLPPDIAAHLPTEAAASVAWRDAA